MGRVELVSLTDGSCLAIWMERGGQTEAGVYARRVYLDGGLSEAMQIGTTTQNRSSGFPRAARRSDDCVVVSWTDTTGEHSRVHLVELDATKMNATLSELQQPAITERPQPMHEGTHGVRHQHRRLPPTSLVSAEIPRRRQAILRSVAAGSLPHEAMESIC